MTSHEPMAAYKAMQKESWNLFGPLEIVTIVPAAALVAFAELQPGQKVLDVACGTGVVAITAARQGCEVKGLDLAPRLLERASENAALAGYPIAFTEGDAEALPYADASFDVVLSQFGHMFAPRAALALQEMLRVLKPGGRIAFSTWPPEHFVGEMFALVSKHAGPPAVAVDPAPLWGDPQVVRQRLGNTVEGLMFERGIMIFPALSVGHYCRGVETTLGPVAKLVRDAASNPEPLQRFRTDLARLVSKYHHGNSVRQHFLMTKATKRSSREASL